MKKRTKVELVIFAIVAAFFLYNQISGIDGNDNGGSDVSSIETELKSSDTSSQSANSAQSATKDTETGNNGKPETAPDNNGDGIRSENGKDSDKAVSSDRGTNNDKAVSSDNGTELSKSSSESGRDSASAYAMQDESYSDNAGNTTDSRSTAKAATVSEDGVYTDRDQVALYIASYGHLPSNYITKNEAKAAGWVSSEGNLNEACPGMSIGGDKFGNREGKLPEKKDRKYFECDINFDKTDGYRGSERIIYSNDGLIYYTGDHYNTFELLYGEP